MKTTTLSLMLMMFLIASSCKKEQLTKELSGDYIVSGTSWTGEYPNTAATEINSEILKVSKVPLHSDKINIKFESIDKNYVLAGEMDNSYSFAFAKGMDCYVGEDMITIYRDGDSIKATFYSSGPVISVCGAKH